MEGQTDAGERRLELMTDGGHQVTLHLVEQAKARHVLELNGGAEGVSVGITDRQNVRQKEMFLSLLGQHDHALKSLGKIRTLIGERLSKRMTDRFGRLPGHGGVRSTDFCSDSENAPSRGVG